MFVQGSIVALDENGNEWTDAERGVDASVRIGVCMRNDEIGLRNYREVQLSGFGSFGEILFYLNLQTTR